MLSGQPNNTLEKFWLRMISLFSKRAITHQFGPTSVVFRVRVTPGIATFFSNWRVFGFEVIDPDTQQLFNMTQFKLKAAVVDLGLNLADLIKENGAEAVMHALAYIHPLNTEMLPDRFLSQYPCSDIDPLAGRPFISDVSPRHYFLRQLMHGSTDPREIHIHRTPPGRDIIFTPRYFECLLRHISAVNPFISQAIPHVNISHTQVAHITRVMDRGNIERLVDRYKEEMFVPVTDQAKTLTALTRDTFMTTVYWQLAMEIVSLFVSLYMPDDVKKYQTKIREFFLLLMIPILLLTQPDLIISFVLFELLETMMRYLGLSKTILSLLVFLLSMLTLTRQGIDDSSFIKFATTLGGTAGIMTVKAARILAQQIWGYILPSIAGSAAQ